MFKSLESQGIKADVLCFETVDSTNLEAKRQVKSGCRLPLLIVADSQTAGKGRMGRSFYSPSSTGLYMSYVYEPETAFSDSITVTSAAAVAVVRAIEKLTDLTPEIKWVNDIYIEGKKVCGILTEAVTADKTAVIIGIGVNITTSGFPIDLRETATSLNADIDRNELIKEIVDNLVELIKGLPQRTFLPEYKKKSLVLGKEICFLTNGKAQEGVSVDINQDGGLVVKTEDGLLTLSTGEITLRLK